MQLQTFLDATYPQGFAEERLPTACRTPMMLQYISVKAKHPNTLLFYRMGDFYEMFFEDAEIASRELDLTLTARNKDSEQRIPMCGVPHHAANGYIQRLTDLGYRVALCDQVEDPQTAKGIVRREVTRVVTPSMVLDPLDVESKRLLFVDAIQRVGKDWAHVRLNTVTGEMTWALLNSDEELLDVLEKPEPQEIIMSDADYSAWLDLVGVSSSHARKCLRAAYSRLPVDGLLRRCAELLQVETTESFGIPAVNAQCLPAVLALLSYATDTQKSSIWSHLTVRHIRKEALFFVDSRTYEHLEVFRSADADQKDSTLVSIFDSIHTGMGRRHLAQRLLQPTQNLSVIGAHQERVRWLAECSAVGVIIEDTLKTVWDVERLANKAITGTLNPTNAVQLSSSIKACVALSGQLGVQSPFALNPLTAQVVDLASEIERVIEEFPAADPAKGRMIRSGVDPELDDMRSVATDTQQWLDAFELEQRQITGISSLKVKYNKVFGFTIEISKANLTKVPAHYQRKQTLSNGERYITEDLLKFEKKWEHAQAFIVEREWTIFRSLAEKIRLQSRELLALAEEIGLLDVSQAAAVKLLHSNYVLPEMTRHSELYLENCRHPVLERLRGSEFVNNTVTLGAPTRFVLLTGPNMSGKSTLMRQVGLCVLLAHAGLPVPASSARIGVMDQLFSRVGASDRLSRGQSTFMVEMVETASILRRATERSLVLIDEIGRGTSTYDGMSLAWAVAQDLFGRINALTFFATHYHELVSLEQDDAHVRCAEMAIQEWEGKIIFLRKLQWGACQKSYGINVARLAGLPQHVLKNAERKLREYGDGAKRPQMSLF